MAERSLEEAAGDRTGVEQMTGVTPTAGAAPQCEEGPAAPQAGAAVPEGRILSGLGSTSVIGARGVRPVGLALRLRASGREDTCAIAVVGEDASLLQLGPFPDTDVVAIWRGLGAASGLPLMIEHADGRLRPLYPQVGPLLVGPIRIRRRHGLLSGRRPRFLVRRKTGRLPQRPLVYREREMFARETRP
jgi:uncharacterized protein DUF6101